LNIIQFIYKNSKHIQSFIFINSYLAVEWCDYSVADIIPEKGKESPKNISEEDKESIFNSISHKEILRQSSEAVSFLHGLGMVHRNLHPDNFLIFCVDSRMGQYLIGVIHLVVILIPKSLKKK